MPAANSTISGLPVAATLTGTEIVPITQSSTTVRTTAQAIANLSTGGSGSTNIDGGAPDSTYGGITPIFGGTP